MRWARPHSTAGHRPARTLTWTSYDKPKTVTEGGQTVTFSYDAFRARIKQVNTLNGETTVYAGDKIPVPPRQSISNLDPNAPTVNEIQFRKTGITLSVTPRVNASGLVRNRQDARDVTNELREKLRGIENSASGDS